MDISIRTAVSDKFKRTVRFEQDKSSTFTGRVDGNHLLDHGVHGISDENGKFVGEASIVISTKDDWFSANLDERRLKDDVVAIFRVANK